MPPVPTPHPIVEDLAQEILPQELQGLGASLAADLANARADVVPELVTFTGFIAGTVPQPGTGTGEQAGTGTREQAGTATGEQAGTATGEQAGTSKSPKLWWLLYLDLRLQSWMLIEETGVIRTERVRDDTVPRADRQEVGERDVVWVRSDASVATGSGPQSVEARFLTGDFTRAGDFDASPTGGTSDAVTGDFCGSPLCCWGSRSRR
jgi:hypothetical protein